MRTDIQSQMPLCVHFLLYSLMQWGATCWIHISHSWPCCCCHPTHHRHTRFHSEPLMLPQVVFHSSMDLAQFFQKLDQKFLSRKVYWNHPSHQQSALAHLPEL